MFDINQGSIDESAGNLRGLSLDVQTSLITRFGSKAHLNFELIRIWSSKVTVTSQNSILAKPQEFKR